MDLFGILLILILLEKERKNLFTFCLSHLSTLIQKLKKTVQQLLSRIGFGGVGSTFGGASLSLGLGESLGGSLISTLLIKPPALQIKFCIIFSGLQVCNTPL